MDYEMWTCAKTFCRLANIPQVLLHYRRHSFQISSRHFEGQMEATKGVRLNQLALLNITPTKEEC